MWLGLCFREPCVGQGGEGVVLVPATKGFGRLRRVDRHGLKANLALPSKTLSQNTKIVLETAQWLRVYCFSRELECPESK